ncbi:E1-E2 ATPase-domain-containing protein [Mycena galopus ATCC 62051]|nr:E1-E2 ATPase-domain-containing protein [Mycena galopus ATCC 62051]
MPHPKSLSECPRASTSGDQSLLSLMCTALEDKVLVLLSIAAVVLLARGFLQDLGTTTTDWKALLRLVGRLSLMYTALEDKALVLLSIAAVVSLAWGFLQNLRTTATGAKVDWVEGVAIMIMIFIVVIVGSVNDKKMERQFQILNEKKEARGVKVICGGVEAVIDIKQVVVRDITLLEPGEIVSCDGVFLGGHNMQCGESGATGESDAIEKVFM